MARYDEIWDRQALMFARYFATRTVMMAVVAFVGLMLSVVAVGIIYVLVVVDNPFSYPSWVDGVAGFFGIGGFLWFVWFLVMSVHSLRRHYWYHSQVIVQR